jgi:hypothetical protein
MESESEVEGRTADGKEEEEEEAVVESKVVESAVVEESEVDLQDPPHCEEEYSLVIHGLFGGQFASFLVTRANKQADLVSDLLLVLLHII